MAVIIKTPEKMVVRTKISYSIANAIRRSVDEIPAIAIDEVEIFKNDSALYDEVLAHRLGLVVLKTENKMGPKTEIDLKLKKKGPGMVYAESLKGNAKIVYDKTPLTLLENEQEIELVATARFGTGLDHAKYAPGIIYYRNLLEVKSGNVKIDSIVENSKSEFKTEKKGNKWVCDLNESDVDKIKEIDDDAVKEIDEILIFAESFGHLDAEKIFAKSIEVLEENLQDFEKNLK